MSGVVDGLLLLVRLVDGEDSRAREELHNEARSNDGGDTKLHKGTTVRSHDDTRPIPGIIFLTRTDSIKGNLGADKEDEQRNGSPQEFVFQRDLNDKTMDEGVRTEKRCC